ncbi:MAG: GDP-mannose 4,6-dehydratase [Flavobacteriaceae bacterium TMED68]|nr:MAG: GDP-mannose 4,6-dehydratase [Flavobacteriaceae bacterium TMED68]|tara:strand:+ start:14827 stop:15861 length:1035 start_codon:yes stop_codon:yes gene_type:complete
MPIALITGITGQDGYYLTEFLLSKGYKVHGTLRRSSTFNTSRIDNLISQFRSSGDLTLHYSDLLDSSSLNTLINNISPDEVYNLAAQSHVAVSFENPIYTTQVGTVGSLSLLEAIRHADKDIKFYQASSSEMYGGGVKESLNEDSPFDPKSPYAVSKVFAHEITQVYRDSYGLFGVNGILFNHESPLRGETFVTRKITRAVGRIVMKLQNKLTLGNLDASRDWGFAGDYVMAMWMMMHHDTPQDWVVATGETYTVLDFAKAAFDVVNLNFEEYVQTSEKYLRPNEVDYLLGNPSKAKEKLKWEPKTSFNELVEMMVSSDMKLAKQERVLIDENLISPTWENPKK